MKFLIDFPQILREYHKGLPKFSYTDVWHFELTPEGWLYVVVSGWAVGFRARVSTDARNLNVNFTLRASDFIADLPESGSVEWEVNPALGYVYTLLNGKPRTYAIQKSPTGKFLPQGEATFEVDLDAIDKALTDDPQELIFVTGGQAYVNNPLSPSSPIFRIEDHFDVEDFCTSSALVRLALGFPYESRVAITPTHVVVHESDTGCYAYTERYVENPYYTSKALLYGLLTTPKGDGVPVPSGLINVLHDQHAPGVPSLVLADQGRFTVVAYEGLMLADLPYESEHAVKAWVDLDDLYRGLQVCGPHGTTLTVTEADGRKAALLRSTEGAALIPTLKGLTI